MTFGQRLKSLRKGRGVSLRWVAKEAGRSVTFLCEVENDKRSVGAETLERLADVFGRTMDELWRGAERDASE